MLWLHWMEIRKIKKMNTYIVVVSWVSDTDLLRSALSDVGDCVYLFDNVFLLKSSWKPTEIRNRFLLIQAYLLVNLYEGLHGVMLRRLIYL